MTDRRTGGTKLAASGCILARFGGADAADRHHFYAQPNRAAHYREQTEHLPDLTESAINDRFRYGLIELAEQTTT